MFEANFSSSSAGVGWGVPPVIPGEGQRGKINDHTKANSPKRAQSRALFSDATSRIIDAIKSPLSHQVAQRGAAENDTTTAAPGPRQKEPSTKQSHGRNARRDAAKAAKAAASVDNERQ